MTYVLPFRELTIDRVADVGGKNASLGELLRELTPKGIRVPDGFAVTADAFRHHLASSNLPERIYPELERLDVRDVQALAQTAAKVRALVRSVPLPPALAAEILGAYRALS